LNSVKGNKKKNQKNSPNPSQKWQTQTLTKISSKLKINFASNAIRMLRILRVFLSLLYFYYQSKKNM